MTLQLSQEISGSTVHKWEFRWVDRIDSEVWRALHNDIKISLLEKPNGKKVIVEILEWGFIELARATGIESHTRVRAHDM